ncbi:unnamed protein product [Sphagnum jensenii]|uniref:OTU domain-containing protein n=1 Tax=Sphagnum jensenii TaxID=128206 RepID=A0ABP1A6T9_9BRYO
MEMAANLGNKLVQMGTKIVGIGQNYATHAKELDNALPSQLTETPDAYSGYVPMQYDDYLENMAKSAVYKPFAFVCSYCAPDVLQLKVDAYDVKISLITSFRDTCFIEIVPKQHKSKREIHLSFWAEVHYNSIYPVENAAKDQSHSTRKKKHRLY